MARRRAQNGSVSIGIRHILMPVAIGAEATRYQEVLKKYPPEFKIGFSGN